jgi:hypothetical protein
MPLAYMTPESLIRPRESMRRASECHMIPSRLCVSCSWRCNRTRSMQVWSLSLGLWGAKDGLVGGESHHIMVICGRRIKTLSSHDPFQVAELGSAVATVRGQHWGSIPMTNDGDLTEWRQHPRNTSRPLISHSSWQNLSLPLQESASEYST